MHDYIKNNNKGFSFVEVIIAFTILVLVSMMAFQLMSTSSTTFSKAKADVDVQSEAQLAANMIKELIIDCQVSTEFFDTKSDASIFWEDAAGTKTYENALLINNDDVQYLIYPNPDPDHADQLLYVSRKRTDGGDPDKFDTPFENNESEVLAEYVSNFYVDTSRYNDTNIIDFSFDYNLRDRKYSGTYQVYMRNKIIIDDNTDYEKADEEAVTQVVVTPASVTITPNTTSPDIIADSQKFTAIVRTTGMKPNGKRWYLSPADVDGFEIDQDGLLTVTKEPTVDSFKVMAEAVADTSKVGSATVRVKKIETLSLMAVSGIVDYLDGVEAAVMNSKVLYSADVSGWNLAASDRGVIWKLEYRPNYKHGDSYTVLTEYSSSNNAYVNYNTKVGQISAGGLVTLGPDATNNYEFRITATALFPNYGYPTTYMSESTLLRVKNQEIKFDGAFVRGVNVDLKAYFLSGEAARQNAVQSDVTEIRSFTRVVGSDGYELSPDLLQLKNGIFYLDFDAFHYQTRDQFKQFYERQVVNVWFLNQNDQEMKMEVVLPAVSVHKGSHENAYIVISKSSTQDIKFSYIGYNVTNANQVGVYIDGEKVSGTGSTSLNRYLSAYVRPTLDDGKSAFGSKDKYVDTQTVRLAASNTSNNYPREAIPLRITLDDFYQVSNQNTRSYIEYDVYIANVQGQQMYIPGPDASGFPSGALNNTKSTTYNNVGPEKKSVKFYKSGSKYYMEYSSRKYVYDSTYSYWKIS